MSQETDLLLDELKQAGKGMGKYAGLPLHVYLLLGDAIVRIQELQAAAKTLANK